ncbi:MAG: protoheme IX farnesyltransferase [Planctomycetia bacterium]|nr:protoheme IX farnesyltransferase [Planctomycetia bacterium]
MSTILAIAPTASRASGWVRVRDYVELTKPRIAVLELVTVAVAAFVARWGAPDAYRLTAALVGTALVAAGASAWNQWIERRSDALMARTLNRPLPAGRLSTREVLWFGSLATIAGVAWLAATVNAVTAVLAAATWATYVCVYTPLKSRSIHNTAVGAVAGAMPILIGWTAVDGRLGLAAATLFLIVFLWQFPHFMAIAWMYRADYAQAGLRMLSAVDPSGRRVGLQAVLGALVLLPVSLLPAVLHVAGGGYFAAALMLGLGQLACAAWFARRLDERSARMLLRASLVYLPLVLLLLTLGPLVGSG